MLVLSLGMNDAFVLKELLRVSLLGIADSYVDLLVLGPGDNDRRRMHVFQSQYTSIRNDVSVIVIAQTEDRVRLGVNYPTDMTIRRIRSK